MAKIRPLKTECMQEGLRVKNIRLLFSFRHINYVIIMGISNLPGNIEMETSSVICLSLSFAMKLTYGPVLHGYNSYKGIDVEVLVKNTDRGF